MYAAVGTTYASLWPVSSLHPQLLLLPLSYCILELTRAKKKKAQFSQLKRANMLIAAELQRLYHSKTLCPVLCCWAEENEQNKGNVWWVCVYGGEGVVVVEDNTLTTCPHTHTHSMLTDKHTHLMCCFCRCVTCGYYLICHVLCHSSSVTWSFHRA